MNIKESIKNFWIGLFRRRSPRLGMLDEQLAWMQKSIGFLHQVNPAEANRVCAEIIKLLEHGKPNKEQVIAVTRLVMASLEREAVIAGRSITD